MKLKRVNIRSFRSIENASFTLDDVTAIVGENNAGKTSLLRALNSCFNYNSERRFFADETHRFIKRRDAYVELTFCNVPQNSQYDKFTRNDQLILRYHFRFGKKSTKPIIQVKDQSNKWVTAPAPLINQLHRDVQFVYIPATRSNQDISWGENSVFTQLLESYVAKNIQRDNLSRPIHKAEDALRERVLSKLEKEINSLYLQERNTDFKLRFSDSNDYRILLNTIEIALSSGTIIHPLQDWGSGTLSLAIIALHRAVAKLDEGNIILGIEEPETNLHPQAQKRFITSLKQQIHGNFEDQVIFTTHSTTLVDEIDITDILLTRRITNQQREEGFTTTVSQVPNDFWNELDREKTYQYLITKNSDFFFAKYVIVAESKNDCQVLKELIKPKIGSRLADISFLNADGVNNIVYPYFLLKELCIPFTIVVDKDYFFPYKNNELDKSRNPRTGLPTYQYSMKSDKVLNDLFPVNSNSRVAVEQAGYSYRKFFKQISQCDILSMNYCLEMDLVCSKAARKEYCNLLHLPFTKTDSCLTTLLVNNKRSIKETKKLFHVLNSLKPSELPESYCKIRTFLSEKVRSLVPK